jgi:hypothetical protein
MADNNFPQFKKKDDTKQTRSEFLERTNDTVWQDRSASECARETTSQPSRTDKSMRADRSDKNSDHSQKNTKSRKTIQAVGWVLKPRSILIDECAAEWGTTRSQAVAKLIDLGLENKILSANSRLLAQIVQETVAKECRTFFNRLTSILFRMYLLLAQVVSLQRNIVARSGYQKKLTAEQVGKIINWSKAQARSQVARKNGDVDASLDQAIEAWLAQEDKEETRGTGEKYQSN